ncbi:MAG: hypothetical protein RL129_95 [Actinomycetota bacterium]|jgi:rfaE bifunctional protein kinase chain/domain/rfaE bifunctional protein nucleotidyltransferase chain/domain
MVNPYELNSLFGHKVISIDKFINDIKPAIIGKKVVLCHGVFDLVHPGHVRHLAYAKSKGNLLVVSITADGFINKGTYRPHVSQKLRALNLAAFEMVDYVIIDSNPTPYDLIQKIQPDIFAKGNEYGERENPKTQEEIELVENYGGSVIFTPGDIVYSSTNLINNVADVKLGLKEILDSESISLGDLAHLFESLHKTRVLVLGDAIVDEIVNCTSIGGQTKTPTLSIRVEESKKYIGGAAIVAAHFAAAGAMTSFCSVTGDDDNGIFLKEALLKLGVNLHIETEFNRPTTLKKVYVANNYRLLKVDVVDNRPIDIKTYQKFKEILRTSDYDIVVFSDFRHGIFTKDRIPGLAECISKLAFKVADSQVASRWGNITDFAHFDLITPNEKEARFSIGDQESTVINLALRTQQLAKAKNLILKLGDKGALSINSSSSQSEGIFTMPSINKKLVDPVGAGDALLAYSALILANSGNHKLATLAGCIAGAMACENNGNVPIEIEAYKRQLSTML